jgi:PKHD-type hydroxylase
MLFTRQIKYNELIHPFVCVDDLFTDEELDKIVKYCESKGLEEAQIVNEKLSEESTIIDKDVRLSSVSMIAFDKEENNWLFEKLWKITNKVNEDTFQYDLRGFNSVQYTVYDGENSRYDFHTDMTTGSRSKEEQLPRKLSFSLVLNDPETFEGGDFQFYFGGHKTETIAQAKGRLIIFPSFNVHRVTAMKSGARKSLVWWVLGPKFR